MWALLTLGNLDPECLPGWLDSRSLWCLLLFPRRDEYILIGLKQNWDRFSAALGPSAHVITLLESESPNSGKELSFPSNYESEVGRFCNKLQVRLDHLPAIILLNASDGRGAPYWSLKRESAQSGSSALESLTSDICAATYDLPPHLDPSEWLTAAARKLLDARSAQEVLGFLKSNGDELVRRTQQLIRTVMGGVPNA